MVDYVDLTQLDVRFLPQTHPASIHFYREGDAIISVPFTSLCSRVVGLRGVEKLLSASGVHHLLYVFTRKDDRLTSVRSRCFRSGTPEADFCVGVPGAMSEWIALWNSESVDPTRFPHWCPRCGRPAYIGMNQIECSGSCR